MQLIEPGQPVTSWLLDPPERFDPVARWQTWLDSLRTLPPDDPGVAEEIARAEETLVWHAEVYPQLLAEREANIKAARKAKSKSA
ncbi:hypothetical protein AGMMS49960_03690 [Betaproteobacteria bacterium]|nr:hypothetical protein AGMMS49543_02490 [Betaproteobacteria bacterium]GHT99146.1 hypothetical protein AGMMS49960_03690 [Betaproteobacteria bacterium]GHU21445.1 hypothetical protein AGMMS50243_19170 [Betaproteobacteria bacterium]